MASHYGDVLREGALAVGDLKPTSFTLVQVTPSQKNTRFQGPQKKIQKVSTTWPSSSWALKRYEGKLGQRFHLVFALEERLLAL